MANARGSGSRTVNAHTCDDLLCAASRKQRAWHTLTHSIPREESTSAIVLTLEGGGVESGARVLKAAKDKSLGGNNTETSSRAGTRRRRRKMHTIPAAKKKRPGGAYESDPVSALAVSSPRKERGDDTQRGSFPRRQRVPAFIAAPRPSGHGQKRGATTLLATRAACHMERSNGLRASRERRRRAADRRSARLPPPGIQHCLPSFPCAQCEPCSELFSLAHEA